MTILKIFLKFLASKETKIIEMNGQEWLVTYEPGKEPMLRPLEKTEPKVVLSSSVKENQNGNEGQSKNLK